MKRIVPILYLAAILSACGNESAQTVANDSIATTVSRQDIVNAPAIEQVRALEASGFRFVGVVNHTEESDPNNMLGRPGGYTSKVDFYDARYPNSDDSMISPNTIEVYETKNAATKRVEYIEAVTTDMPMLRTYMYQSGASVLRLDRELTPTIAREYEAAFVNQ